MSFAGLPTEHVSAQVGLPTEHASAQVGLPTEQLSQVNHLSSNGAGKPAFGTNDSRGLFLQFPFFILAVAWRI